MNIKAQLQEVGILKERFKKTVDILVPTFNYTDSLDEHEQDYCEQTFHEIAPCYMYMYSVVVDKKIPDAYNNTDAQLEMFDKTKVVAQITAATYRHMTQTVSDDKYRQGFVALLETFLLLYYAYMNGLPEE